MLAILPLGAEVLSDAQAAKLNELSVRNAHAMVYDTDRQQVLLFGGADAGYVHQDTWQWDNATRIWQFVTDSGPGPRTFPALAYDERNHAALLFGGNRVLFGTGKETDSFLGDTWLYRNGQWKKVNTAGPGGRAEAAVAYDRDRGRVVLFGGYRRIGENTQRFGDTWEWDGRRWQSKATSGPSPRNGAAMAYDQRRHRVVLFGGPGPSNETWEWNGHRWNQIQAGDVPGRFNPVMAYDVARHEVVRFGGWTGTVRANDTWVLQSGRWVLLNVAAPPARNHSAMVYDRKRDRAILFGGHDGDSVFGDTWEWDGTMWTLVASVPREKFVDNGH